MRFLFNPIRTVESKILGLVPRGKSCWKNQVFTSGSHDHQPPKNTIKMVTLQGMDTYPTLGSSENHLQNAIFGGYVSSLEGNSHRGFFQKCSPKCLVNDTDTPSKKNIHVDGKKSCTTWGCIKSWQIMEITSPSTGAGCLPSTVAPETMASQKQRIVVRPRSFRCLC